MAKYYVNRNEQNNGDHEVHKAGCRFMPEEPNSLYLGDYTNCQDAVREAKKTYGQSNGCYYCSKDCHTS